VLQVLVGSLAGLLLLEAWLRRHEADHAAANETETDRFEFHPELLVRWDDEARHRRRPACTRGVARRDSRQLADATHRRSFDR
jgi:hypothetical protein